MTVKAPQSKKTRSKATSTDVPQTRESVQSWIKQLGEKQRELARQQGEMNDKIAEITDDYKPQVNALSDDIKTLHKGIQTWCEAHRDELTEGKGKTVNLLTGEVSWRLRPPSVSLRGKDTIIASLRKLGLERFIRVKEDINKEAMLAEEDIAATVAGVTIKTGVEDFVIKPFEQQVE